MLKRNFISLIIIAGIGLAIGNIHSSAPKSRASYEMLIKSLERNKKTTEDRIITKKRLLMRETAGTESYNVLERWINQQQEKLDEINAKLEEYNAMIAADEMKSYIE